MGEHYTHESSQADRKIIRDINKHGWHVTYVRGKGEAPGWAFSVGLYHTFKHPEILLFGLSSDLMCRVINNLGEDIRSGKVYESGKEYPYVLKDALCTFRTVEKIWYPAFVGNAVWFYQGNNFPILQVVWPDKEQNYPWSPKFGDAWLWAQPLLFHRGMEDARVENLLRFLCGDETQDNKQDHSHSSEEGSAKSSHPSDGHYTKESSHHKFGPGEWPFSGPENIRAFTTTRVLYEQCPILGVVHETDGVWQMLCGTTTEQEHCRLVCLGCVYDLDRTIAEVADLPRGWEAWREDAKSPWQRSEIPLDEDE